MKKEPGIPKTVRELDASKDVPKEVSKEPAIPEGESKEKREEVY